jgi:hypothetical protein
VSGADHLRALAEGRRPPEDGLLSNARFASAGGELLGEEAILAAFVALSPQFEPGLLSVETGRVAALIGDRQALVADLYGGRIARIWQVGAGSAPSDEPAIDVAFDPDMRQERGDLEFRAEDHPDLEPGSAGRLLSACRDLVEQGRREGKLRVRGFVVRAFGGAPGSAALMSLFELGNEPHRSAAFSYAVIGLGPEEGAPRVVRDRPRPRAWTPRF